MYNEKYVRPYIKEIQSDKENYFEDYQKMQTMVNQSDAIYKGQPIPVTYQGMFSGPEHVENFQSISETLMSITQKVTEEYLRNPDYRKLFRFDSKVEELILHDPGYALPVPICRYDLFYNGIDDFKFCEFNTDGSSAMNEDSTLGSIMLGTKGFLKYQEKYELKQFELFDSWVKTALSIYQGVPWSVEQPNVAIVDFIDKGTTNEFLKFKKAFEDAGVNCEIIDPRELDYDGENLTFGDYKIDLIYRRAVTMDIMEKFDEIQPMIRAFMDDKIVLIGSFRSHIMHTKLVFKILRLPETRAFLTEEENAFLRDHIPYTEEFITQDDFERVRLHKDDYILKPYEGYASYKVYAGREHSREEWEQILKEILNGDYIYQEYFDMDKIDFVEFEQDGSLIVTPFSAVHGMFIYGGDFQGLYTRIGNQALISGARRYYTAPNFLVRER